METSQEMLLKFVLTSKKRVQTLKHDCFEEVCPYNPTVFGLVPRKGFHAELIRVGLRALVLSGQESLRAFWCYRSSSLVALPRVPNW